jgi:phosphoribosylformylglycinamidine (FGAM) synthase PurS component
MSGAYLDGIPKGMGPNSFIKNNQSDLYTLKLNDNNYENLFDTVKGILNNEMKNPNIEKMHLINAQIKHKEND